MIVRNKPSWLALAAIAYLEEAHGILSESRIMRTAGTAYIRQVTEAISDVLSSVLSSY